MVLLVMGLFLGNGSIEKSKRRKRENFLGKVSLKQSYDGRPRRSWRGQKGEADEGRVVCMPGGRGPWSEGLP